MRWSALLLLFFACGGDIERENVATTQDAGTPNPIDGGAPALDATVIDGGPAPTTDGATVPNAPCAKDADCQGGSCFEGMCMCQLPKYVQADGRCGDAKPPECNASNGT